MCNHGNYGTFYDKGAELQMNSNSWWQSKKNYLYSCMLCWTGNVGSIPCKECPIRGAMLQNASIFETKMTQEEKDWVEKERQLL